MAKNVVFKGWDQGFVVEKLLWNFSKMLVAIILIDDLFMPELWLMLLKCFLYISFFMDRTNKSLPPVAFIYMLVLE